MAAAFDPNTPFTLTPNDVGFLRRCRAVWVPDESGAPGVVPDGIGTAEYVQNLFNLPPWCEGSPAAAHLQPILCAAFLHATFAPGSYVLDPPVRPQDTADGRTVLPSRVVVTPDHLTLLRRSSWSASFMDGKRPYGNLTYYEAEMALALGQTPPVAADGAYLLPAAEEAWYQALHGEMLPVVQAFLQHAALAPGCYALPRDGWSPPLHPRCAALPPAQLARYHLFCAETPEPVGGAQGAAGEYAVRHFVAKQALFAP